jgi:L-threonylcarbamoyladenylate synthase
MTRVIRINAEQPEPERIHDAADLLRRGGLVAFPTVTVYGLGAHALDAKAVQRIFAAKGRPHTDPMIVHLADASSIGLVAREIPPLALDLAAAFWPGPLTMIVAKGARVPDAVTAGLPAVAIRVPSHPIAHALIAAAGVPVAAPSANRFSRPSPTSAEHVLADLDGRIDLVIDGGATAIGVESTIIDLTVLPPVIRRPGGVSSDALRRIVPDVQLTSAVLSPGQAQPSPGQLSRHYAPRARMILYVGDLPAVTARVADDVRAAVAAGHRVGVLGPEEDLRELAPRLAAVAGRGRVVTARCGSRADRDDAARQLFVALRALDDDNVDVIYATVPAGDGINTAIVDRLTRASDGRVHWVIA